MRAFRGLTQRWLAAEARPFMNCCRFLALIIAALAVISPLGILQAQQPAPSAPIVRSIDVQYAGPAAISKEKILANMRTRVGRAYDDRVVEEDIRNLYATGNIT